MGRSVGAALVMSIGDCLCPVEHAAYSGLSLPQRAGPVAPEYPHSASVPVCLATGSRSPPPHPAASRTGAATTRTARWESPRHRLFIDFSFSESVVGSMSAGLVAPLPVLRPWRGPESNRGHHDFQSCALPTELPRPSAEG